MSVRLICVKGPYTGREFPVGARGSIIGRDPASASIVLDIPSISRSHANVFAAPDGSVVVQDLGSTNGTWTISAAGERKRVTNDTVIPDRGRFSVGDGDNCVFEVAFAAGAQAESPQPGAPEAAGAAPVAPAFAAPIPASPADVQDTWADALRILSQIFFVLLVLGGIVGGYQAYQLVSMGPIPMQYKLASLFLPIAAGIVCAFFQAAFLNMAADTREIRNCLIRRQREWEK
jgi:hypothetical protein